MPTLKIKLSKQSVAILEELASYGIYGITPNEVASRFVDQKLIDICHQSSATPFFTYLHKTIRRVLHSRSNRK